MMSREEEKAQKAERAFFGLDNGLQVFSPGSFGGMDRASSRMGMDDRRFWWLENYVRLGSGALRTLPDYETFFDSALSGVIRNIFSYFFYNINGGNYVILIDEDGKAVQVNTDTGAQTTIANSNPLFSSLFFDYFPCYAQWGTKYLLIANNTTPNDYFVWDGTVLYRSGSLGPTVELTASGSGYAGSSPPYLNLSAYGGTGTGATFSGVVINGNLTQVTVTNPGSQYVPGDVVGLRVTGSNVPALLTAVLTATTVYSISVLARGYGYSATPTVTLTPINGVGAGATASAVVSGGEIVAITVTAVGAGYTGTVRVTITDATGKGALAQCFLAGTTLASVTITDAGNSYPVAPTVQVLGGGGSGATVTTTIGGGGVIATAVVGSGGQSYTSTPTLIVQPGVNTAAQGIIEVMPFGVSGSSMETYASRVWLQFPSEQIGGKNAGTRLVSAPDSFLNFATSAGGLITENTDPSLRTKYTGLKQNQGYLYSLGDSSVTVISNVETSGSPPSTTFQPQVISPQVGTLWRDTIQVFDEQIVFANSMGVYSISGGTVRKISDPIDTLYDTVTETIDGFVVNRYPTACVAVIYNKKHYCLFCEISDSDTGEFSDVPRRVMLAWDGQEWYVFSQGQDAGLQSGLYSVGTQQALGNIFGWGSDDFKLYKLFSVASTSLTKTLSTKLYGGDSPLVQKRAMGVYVQTSIGTVVWNTSGFIPRAVINSEHGQYQIPSILPQAMTSQSGASQSYYPINAIGSGDVVGVNLGLTLTTTSADFVINFVGISYIDEASIALSSTPLSDIDVISE